MTALVDFLSQFSSIIPVHAGFKYNSIYDYVLKNGREFASAALEPGELAVMFDALENCTIKKFPAKQCFSNSQLLALAGPSREVQYIEGYAWSSAKCPIPVHHGWVEINGKVIDLTWRFETKRRYGRLRDRCLGEFPEDRMYFGATFSHEMVLKFMHRRGFVGSLLDDWQHGWTLLKGEQS